MSSTDMFWFRWVWDRIFKDKNAIVLNLVMSCLQFVNLLQQEPFHLFTFASRTLVTLAFAEPFVLFYFICYLHKHGFLLAPMAPPHTLPHVTGTARGTATTTTLSKSFEDCRPRSLDNESQLQSTNDSSPTSKGRHTAGYPCISSGG